MASRLGLGEFRNVYGSNGSNVTAGQQDYAERMNQIENQREAYYRKAGVAPGLPTMKGSYADPEVTGVGYNVLIDSLGDHSVPENWVQRPVINTEAGSNPGAPLAWGAPENPDDAVAGYGYVPCDTSEVEETFYYHSDHLGSTSYITDQQANVTQYDAYLPYGELLVDEHSSSADLPYKFNGKELDEETGLYYYGARYMNPVTSMWYGVDPLTEQYVNIGAYIYCHGNPIILFDPDGQGDYFAKNGQYLGRDKWDDNKVFLADGIVNGHFHNIKRLDVSQHRFKVMANIIAQEGSSKDPEEYTFIANIARNEANAQGRSMWSLLTSGYSSVPDTKTELSNKDNSQKANMARAALIGVVLGNPDPTNGSRFWDGSDFLAWGTGPYKDPKGIERVAHPKFRQYKSIIIPKEIFEKYCAAHKSATIKYYGERYNIPEAVFLNKNNWKNGYFEYSYPKSKGTRTLVATATRGKTIYWKLK